MTRPADDPELSDHLRRELKRELRARIEAARSHAMHDNDPRRRESKRRHERAMAAALVTYGRTWERLAPKGPREGNR